MSTSARTRHVCADAGLRPRRHALFARTLGCVRADRSVLSPGNFRTDATVHPSHGRASGHRPIVCPFIIVCVTTLSVPSAAVVLPNTSKFGSSCTVGICVSPCVCSLNCPSALLSLHVPLSTSTCSGGACDNWAVVLPGELWGPRPLLRKLALRSSRGFWCQVPEPLQAL
jgi:hypothetical protein